MLLRPTWLPKNSSQLLVNLYLHVKEISKTTDRMATKTSFNEAANFIDATTSEEQRPPFLVTDSEDCFQKALVWTRIRHCLREPFSEFFGTFVMILFGDGVVAQVTLSQDQRGDYQSISWGWG
jgi:hypothetical protein